MSTEKILCDLIEAQERVTALTAEMQQASEDRDRCIALARKAGTSAVEISRLTGVNRARVYQILDRTGLRA